MGHHQPSHHLFCQETFHTLSWGGALQMSNATSCLFCCRWKVIKIKCISFSAKSISHNMHSDSIAVSLIEDLAATSMTYSVVNELIINFNQYGSMKVTTMMLIKISNCSLSLYS